MPGAEGAAAAAAAAKRMRDREEEEEMPFNSDPSSARTTPHTAPPLDLNRL